jgi:spore coat protein CotH
MHDPQVVAVGDTVITVVTQQQVDELLELLDQFLATTASRNLVSADEVQDLALDMRNIVTRAQEGVQEDEVVV